MPGPEDQDTNLETPNEELASQLEEISSDLFGPGSDEDGGEGGGEEDSSDAAESQASSLPEDAKGGDQDLAAGETGGEDNVNSPEVRAIGAPETWTKEALEEWAKIPPRAQQEIKKREEDMHRGLAEYKERAEIGDKYQKVVEPYAPILAAENIDPVELFSAFSGNHYILSRGTPEQKLQVAANLVKSYGLDIDQIKAQLEGYTPPSAEVLALNNRIAELEKGQTTFQQQQLNARRQELAAQVDAFVSDPANIYWEEVADDILGLFKSGQASDLRSAYDKAVYLNPVTRQKEIDRLSAEKVSAAEKERADKVAAAEKAKGANVKTSSKTRDGTVPVGTMDDTIDETLRKIQARGG